MALSDEENATMRRLSAQLTRGNRDRERLRAYYKGIHRLERLGLAVPPELDRFITVVNWPRVTVDSIEQRCDVEGFRLPGADSVDDELWGIWQANGLDERSQQAHLASLEYGRAYVCVGARGPDDQRVSESRGDVPLVTVETPFEMTHETDPRTQRVTAALRRTQAAVNSSAKYATLYLPNETIWLQQQGSRGWVELDRDQHGIGEVPVVPLINRATLDDPDGESEMSDVISLTDAACRALTNAQVATEVLAVPQRYILGASPKDFVDQHGKPLTAWETYFGAVWALQNGEAKVGQFSAADLKNFETIVNFYANLVSGVSGLPTRFYGQYTTNPPSEGSIVADETRLIMNSRRKHRSWGGSWEWSNRLVRRIIDGEWNLELARMETLWHSPETPTRAQQADAAVKLYPGKPIITRRQAREDLGYSEVQIANMERDDAQEAALDPMLAAAARIRTGLTPDEGAAATEQDETVPGAPFADSAPVGAGQV